MGKDSLIKSTTKKAAPKKEVKKKASTKSAKSAQPKKTAKSQSKSSKTTSGSKKTSTPKTAPKKAAPALSTKEILFKQFQPRKPLVSETTTEPDFSKMTAPSFIDSSDPKEVVRLRKLLSRRFNMSEIKAAAKAPEEGKVAVKPESKPTSEPETQKAAPQTKPADSETAWPISSAAKMPETPIASPPSPEPEESFSDPVERAAKLSIAAIAALLLLIVWASFSNSSKYFVVQKKGAVEIWRGEFSPTGKQFFAVLHGLKVAKPVKATYARREVYPMIFDYYLQKADDLLDVSGLPDYKSIIEYLEKAQKYALDNAMRNAVDVRLNNIHRMTLLYKADVDISKGTAEALQSALQNLKQLQQTMTDPAQLEVINQKIALVTERQNALKAKADTNKAASKQAAEGNEPAKPAKNK